jgi:simple sugar transport system ATP-binding protein
VDEAIIASDNPGLGECRTSAVRASRQEAEDMAGQISDQLLGLRGIGMEYGAIRALAEVDYTVAQGEIVGLIGDNGAGKSTLVKIIAGNFPPTHGIMHFDGHEVRFRGPEDARNAGIEVVYQDLALADNLSGAANVFLGRELRRRVAGLRIMDHAAMTRRAAQLFAELKSETRPEALVRTLSGG